MNIKLVIKEWGLTFLIIFAVILSRVFIWSHITVLGHSMDPTLADNEHLIIDKISDIKRFDIVYAKEKNDKGITKNIVKRIIGLPGDTIEYNQDRLTINKIIYSENYLKDFQSMLKIGELGKTYDRYPLTKTLNEEKRKFFVSRAQNAHNFTNDNTGKSNFIIKVPKGRYFLMGDNRIISSDSRYVGTFKRSEIVGKEIFRIWPFNKIGSIQSKNDI